MSSRSQNRSPSTISVQEMEGRRGIKNYIMGGFKVLAFVIGFIPIIGVGISSGISYVVDRISNRTEANKELELRTKYYSEQIGMTLGMNPRSVTVKDFAKAAEINPSLRRLYLEPIQKKSKENRMSGMINGGTVAAVGLIPGGHVAAHGMKAIVEGVRGAGSMAYVAKSVAGGLAGGALGSALATDKVEAQKLLEAMEKTVADADQKGIPRNQAINPQLIFTLRVSQDELFAKQIEKQFGAKLHKMTPQQMNGVMAAFPALAASSQREAYAVAQGIMPIRDLGATAPNLNGSFAGSMVNSDNASHVKKLTEQRAAAQQQAAVTA